MRNGAALQLVGLVWVALVISACTCPRLCDLPPAEAAYLDHAPAMDAAVVQALAAHPGQPVDVLALSGGGQNGAFAAGVLRSWRDQGRPAFRIVTGVSIGAILAPLAFLGTPDTDEVMRTAFDGLSRDQVFPSRPAIAIPFDGSLYRPAGIERILKRRINDGVIRRVAAASQNGDRLLLVGTTNLDTGALHMWDLGHVARAGQHDRFRKILLASASVPIFLPAVEIDGCLHADGAVTQQVFVPALGAARTSCGNVPVTVHAIANTAVYVKRACQPRSILKRGTRALKTMMRTTMIDNLWRLWGRATRDGASVRIIVVPEAVASDGEFLSFEPSVMRRLYQSGLSEGISPTAWRDIPPPHRVETTR